MITLGISTASSRFALVIGQENNILYDSELRTIEDKKDIVSLFLEGLKLSQKKVADIERIIIDKGPGGTSSVRTGLAFANSLAFSLKIPVIPVSSFELAGIAVWEQQQISVISTVKSLKNNAFIGYFKGYNDFSIYFGKIAEIVPDLVKDVENFAVTGFHREIIKELLPDKIVYDSKLNYGNVELLIKKQTLFAGRELLFPKYPIPITERSVMSNTHQ